MAAPPVAEQECQSDKGEELFEFSGFCHMGIFQVEPTLLEMTEELFDPPSQLVKFECLRPMEAVADEVNALITPPFAGDGFAGKENVHSENLLSCSSLLPLARGTVFASYLAPDDGIRLDAGNVANPLLIKPFEPFLATKFPVHGQNRDLFWLHDTQDFREELDAMVRMRVSAFGGLWQHPPSEGNSNPVDDDANGEDVDMSFAMFPIGAVHGKNPTFFGTRNPGKDEATDGGEAEGATKEKALEATVATLVGGSSEVLGGEESQIDRAMAQQTGDEKRDALDAGEIESERSELCC